MPLSHNAVRRLFATMVVIVLAPALPHPAQAAGAPLTLAEAQSIAVARAPQVAAFGHAAQAAREMAVAAGRLPDPVLKLGIDNLPVEGADRFNVAADPMTMRQIGVMQELTAREKRDLRSERSELEAGKSLAERSLAVANVERDTALAWLDRYYAEAMRKTIDEEAAEARLQVEAADSAYRAGRGSQADTFAARSALALLEDRGSDIDRRLRAARLALSRWVGGAADRPLEGAPPIADPPLGMHDLRSHIERHPEIAVYGAQERIAANEARQALAARTPDWSVSLMYSVRGSAFPNMVSLDFSVPLPWDRPHRQDREAAAKRAMEEEAGARREDAVRMHVADVGALLAEWETGRERLARYARQILPLAGARAQAALAAYRGAKGSLADVLAARRDELEIRLAALQLESDNARAWAQLAFLIPGDNANPKEPR